MMCLPNFFKTNLACCILWLAGWVLSGCSSQPILTKQNIAPNYQPAADFALSTDHLIEEDSMRVWVRFGSKKIITSRLPGDLEIELNVFQTYESKVPLYSVLLEITDQKVQWQNQKAVANLAIPRELLAPGGLVSIRFADHSGAQTNATDIPLGTQNLDKKYILLEPETTLPLFRNYVNANEKFRIATSYGDTAIKVTHYKTEFPPALPPMSLSQKNASPTIPVLASQNLSTTRPQQLQNEGLYALQPALGSQGILLVLPGDYPELTTAQELIDPLIYITTSREREKLTKSENPKKAVDNFWLQIGGSEQYTRNLIRAYYTRVTDANRLFTSHKPGWMSDRGMIFIVMGRPTKVNRFADREEWIYTLTDNRPTTQFTFLRKEHTLTQNHYELVRDPVFEPVWYSAAEQWRKGIIDP